MWQPYVDVIRDKASQALLMFDKFHIFPHLTKTEDKVHKALMARTRVFSALLEKTRVLVKL